MVVDDTKNYESLPNQEPVKIDNLRGPGYEREEEWEAHGIVRTADLGVSWVSGEPGAEIPWHTHAPDFYQILVCIEGTNRWYYRDNEGKEQHIDVEAGETLFLPGGSTNREVVIGDGRHTHITITPRLFMNRWEHFVEGEYPRVPFPGALEYDNFTDEVIRATPDAIVENRRDRFE